MKNWASFAERWYDRKIVRKYQTCPDGYLLSAYRRSSHTPAKPPFWGIRKLQRHLKKVCETFRLGKRLLILVRTWTFQSTTNAMKRRARDQAWMDLELFLNLVRSETWPTSGTSSRHPSRTETRKPLFWWEPPGCWAPRKTRDHWRASVTCPLMRRLQETVRATERIHAIRQHAPIQHEIGLVAPHNREHLNSHWQGTCREHQRRLSLLLQVQSAPSNGRAEWSPRKKRWISTSRYTCPLTSWQKIIAHKTRWKCCGAGQINESRASRFWSIVVPVQPTSDARTAGTTKKRMQPFRNAHSMKRVPDIGWTHKPTMSVVNAPWNSTWQSRLPSEQRSRWRLSKMSVHAHKQWTSEPQPSWQPQRDQRVRQHPHRTRWNQLLPDHGWNPRSAAGCAGDWINVTTSQSQPSFNSTTSETGRRRRCFFA